jgi:predicted DNA-binding antitoxin AbrB/MazE fold protein
MSQDVDAIYENGMFRPQAPVNVQDGERVRLIVQRSAEHSEIDADDADLLDWEFIDECRRDTEPAPSLEEVQASLSKYQGSIADMISQERDER